MSSPLQSDQIDQLASALVECQHSLTGAIKDSTNPFFKSEYADLEACWAALREPLHVNGLSVTQTTRVTETGGTVLITTMLHKSGQWIKGELLLAVAKANDPQAQGSSITYGRRYALQAITGLYPVDDDGEAAKGRAPQTKKSTPASPSASSTSGTAPRAAASSTSGTASQPVHTPQPPKPVEGEEPSGPVLVTPAQMEELSALAKANGWAPFDVTAWIQKTFQIPPSELRGRYTLTQYQATCKWVQAKKPGEE